MYVRKIVFRCTVALNKLAHAQLDALKGAADFDASDLLQRVSARTQRADSPLYNHLLCADGFLVRLRAPPASLRTELASTHFSVHYNRWGLTVLVCVDTHGKPVFITKPEPMQETSLIKKLELNKVLERVEREAGAPIGMLTDSGFAINTDSSDSDVPHAFTIGPKTLHRLKLVAFGRDLGFSVEEQQLAYQALTSTRYASTWRVVVENFNAMLRTYRVLDVPFRGRVYRQPLPKYMPRVEHIVASVSFLVTFRMENGGKPLRADDWQPKPLSFDGEPVTDEFEWGYPAVTLTKVVKQGGKSVTKKEVHIANHGTHFGNLYRRFFASRQPELDKKIERQVPDRIENEDDAEEFIASDESVFAYLNESHRPTTRRSRTNEPARVTTKNQYAALDKAERSKRKKK